MEKKAIDWPAVEREYRAGLRSLKAIGEQYGVSDAGIIKRAKRDGWTRDLTAKIQAKADALVSADAVSAEVSSQTKIAEREVVEANGEMLASVIRGHRRDLGRLRGVVNALLVKVEAILSEPVLFAQLGELCAAPDDNGMDRINDLYRKVIDLPVQTDTTKKLAETLKVLIELERKVFKLDVVEDPIESAARGAAEGAARGMSEVSQAFITDLMTDLSGANE